jgi:hypothetical protein
MKTILLTILLGLACATLVVTAASSPNANSVEKITERAYKIIIPRAHLREASLQEVVEFLNKKSKELDPEKIGIELQVTAKGLATADQTKISFALDNVPYVELLKYISHLASLEYEITASKIILGPSDGK